MKLPLRMSTSRATVRANDSVGVVADHQDVVVRVIVERRFR